jgi:hypothetical protein
VAWVINWLYHSDDSDANFWRSNVLSGRALRRNFPVLYVKSGAAAGTRTKKAMKPCPDCGGKGVTSDDNWMTAHRCTTCKGKGGMPL